MKRLHPLWAEVYILENENWGSARVLPRRRPRRKPRGMWLVYGFLAGDIIIFMNVLIALRGH